MKTRFAQVLLQWAVLNSFHSKQKSELRYHHIDLYFSSLAQEPPFLNYGTGKVERPTYISFLGFVLYLVIAARPQAIKVENLFFVEA
jgi:hypothetical protein